MKLFTEHDSARPGVVTPEASGEMLELCPNSMGHHSELRQPQFMDGSLNQCLSGVPALMAAHT